MEKINRLIFSFLLAAIVLAGCATQQPDPLAGWMFRYFDGFGPPSVKQHYQLDKVTTDDYQAFITTNHLDTLGAITGFFEDGKGQRAVGFEAFPPGQNATWHYVLFYDNEGKRIKVIKYGYRRFQS